VKIGYVLRDAKCWYCKQELGVYNGYDPGNVVKELEKAHFPWKCKSSRALEEREHIFKETDESALTHEEIKQPREKALTSEEFNEYCAIAVKNMLRG